LGRSKITTPKANRDWKNILPGLLVSAVALLAVFLLADLDKLVEALRLADYRIILLAIPISLAWLLVRAIVWRTLLQEKATLSQTFFTINEGYLLNNILPFRLGEVARAFLLGRKADLNFWQVFPTVLIERALDLAMAAGLLLSTLPFVVGASWALQAAIAAGSIVLAGLGGLYLLARNREWAMRQFEKLAARWPTLQKVGSRQLQAFFTGLAVLTDLRRFLRAIFWVLVNWLIAIVQYYAFVRAFFPQAQLLWGAFSLGVMALGVAAPSSPGSIGVMELALVGALSLFGLDNSVSLALALTAHLNNYLITGLLGAYALARDGETLAGIYHRARHISATNDQNLPDA
jgi:hypothetical protein